MSDGSTHSLGSQLGRAEIVTGGDPVDRLLSELQRPGRVRTQNLRDAARGYVLARLSRSLNAPVLCITADEDSADTLASDLAFFMGGQGTLLEPRVLRLPADEVTPFEELAPDAVTVSERLGALYHLRQGTR